MAKKDKQPRTSIGKQAQSIFSPTTEAPKEEHPSRKAGIGRPKVLPDDVVKSTVTFYNQQIVWLERVSASIRERSKSVVDRSTIIRAILSAIEESGIDLSDLEEEEEIKHRIKRELTV